MGKTFYTTTEIARMFNVYTTTVADWIDSGRLFAYKTVGGHRRVTPDHLKAFLKEFKMPIPPTLNSSSISILIIDDNPDESGYLKERLESKFIKVEIAEGGFDGMYKIGRFRPDLVILDLRMPGMDGFEVCEEIKTKDELKDIPVIAITGYPGDDIEREAMAKGATAFLRKPVDYQELEQLILKLTGVAVS